MSRAGTDQAPDTAALLAQDLRTLAWLHAAERNSACWLALFEQGFPQGLTCGDTASREALQQALADLRERLHAEPADPTPADAALAADYADIYLTHALLASPYESVWRDEDHLMLQAPTFAVRRFYQRHGLQVADWRQMPDDHLSHELGFVALLLERGEWSEAARFLDEHLLVWLPGFAARVAERAATEVYAALAVLTLAACRSVRAALQLTADAAAACGA